MKICQPEKFLYSKKLQRREVNKVGEGKYGQVFVGCTDLSCQKQIAVKKSLDDMSAEFKILQRAYKIAPNSVPRPYLFTKCESSAKSGSIIYYQYIKSRTLGKSKISKDILFKLLITLYKFKKHGIRHNDLHLGNILIEDGTHRPYITDFGLANSTRTNLEKNYGISPDSDSRYDYHFMLNSIFSKFKLPFISRVIPREYLGTTSSKIQNHRLRYGIRYPGLPSLCKILDDRYFDSCRKN